MLSRGFVGPIGDDLPSLIPLLLGLVIFFSTFTLAFSAFDARNTDFRDDIAVLRISRTLQSNSYIYSWENFHQLCSQIDVLNIKYVAGITDKIVQANPDDPPAQLYDLEFFSNGTNRFYCSSTEPSAGGKTISEFITQKGASERKIVTRVFPIVVEDSKIVRPMHLVVIAWK